MSLDDEQGWFAGAFQTLLSRSRREVLGGTRDEALRTVLASDWEVLAHLGPEEPDGVGRSAEPSGLLRALFALDTYLLRHRSTGVWALLSEPDRYTSAATLEQDWAAASLRERHQRLARTLLCAPMFAPTLLDLLDLHAADGQRDPGGEIRAALLDVEGEEGDAARFIEALRQPRD